MTYFSINVIFVIISLLASFTLYFQKNTPLYLKLFPVFLLVTLVVEVLGIYLMNSGKSNVLLFNCFTTIEFVFYLFVLRNIVVNNRFRKIITYVLFIYPAATFAYIFFILPRGHFHTVTYSIGCLLIVAVCIYYFFELFQLPTSLTLLREPAFWICSGLLFFYCCSFPLFGLLNFLNSVSNVIIRNIAFILQFLNVLLYFIFTIAFLCRIRMRRSPV